MHHKVVKSKINKTIILLLALMIGSMFVTTTNSHAAIITDEYLESTGDKKPNIFEKTLSKTLLNVSNTLIGLTGAQDVTTLVFQRPEVVGDSWITNSSSADRESMAFGIFPPSVFNGISAFYDMFVSLLPVPMLIILTIAGLMLLVDVMRSPNQRTNIKEHLLGVIIALVLIRFGHMIWDLISYVNFIIVDTVYFLLIDNGISVTSFLNTIWDQGSSEEVFKATNLVVAGIVFCAVFMTFSINYQYMMRIFILGTLIVMFPGVILSTIMPSRRNVLNQWCALFGGQIFIQAAHSIALGLFFFFLTDGIDFWLICVMFFALPAITDVVQRIVSWILGEGFGGGIGTSLGNATGVSSLMGIAALGRSMMKSNNSNSMPIGENRDSRLGKSPIQSGSLRPDFGGSNNLKDHSFKGTGSPSSSLSDSQRNNSRMQGMTISEPQGTYNTGSSSNSLYDSSSSSDAHVPTGNTPIDNKVNSGNREDTSFASNETPKQSSSAPSAPKFKAKSGTVAKAGLKNAGKTLRHIGQAPRRFGGSERFKRNAKMMALVGGALAGASIGTMVTGKANSGMVVGAGAGLMANKAIGSSLDKGSRLTELSGEMMQSKGEGNSLLHHTKQRVGFQDSAQFADSGEMKKMGREVIGGKTGEMLGNVTAKTNYASSKLNSKMLTSTAPPSSQKSPINKSSTSKVNPKDMQNVSKPMYQAVDERQNLINNSIPRAEANIALAKAKVDESSSQVQLAKAMQKANPNDAKYAQRTKAAEKHHSQQVIQYETRKKHHEQIVQKADKFYENEKIRKDVQRLHQPRKSGGEI